MQRNGTVSLQYSLQKGKDPGGLLDLSSLQDAERDAVGSKASQLREVNKFFEIAKWKNAQDKERLHVLSHGYVIPFYFYHRHMQSCCVGLLDALYREDEVSGEREKREESKEKSKEGEQEREQEKGNEEDRTDETGYVNLLKRVQAQIEEAEIGGEDGAAMVEAVYTVIHTWREKGILPAGKGVILRSSTNVEDLPGYFLLLPRSSHALMKSPFFKNKIQWRGIIFIVSGQSRGMY